MKKKIAILGSTGSIGKTLLNIIEKDKKNFEITLLSANKDYRTLLQQSKKFKVKNLIINDKGTYQTIKKKKIQSNIKIHNSFENLNKIFKQKVDYTMNSIVGIDGLNPTLKIIKYSKRIAIANKESIICGWSLIQKELEKYKTEFIPVDSEHFSMWYELKDSNPKNIEKIYITASGGPFNRTPLNHFKNITIQNALNHPNWKMGKKISIDSATMINKVYEVIEAKNIFDIPYKKIEIIVHPKSYAHCLLKFDNGLLKIIFHETTMKIPIFNTLYFNTNKKIQSKKIDLQKLNKMNLQSVNLKRFPIVKILKLLPNKNSLYETVIVSANDYLVELFLNKKIKFIDIQKKLFNIIMSKEFLKLKKKIPKNVKDIVELNKYVRSKIEKKVYKSLNV